METTATLRHADSLPGPRGLPLLGNALQLDTARLHQQLERWAAEYGPFYKFSIGGRKVVVVSDHDIVAQVLRDRPDGFRRTTKLEEIWLETGLPGGVFGANGESWRQQRRMVMAAFAPEHVRQYHPALVQVAQRLASRWSHAAREDRAIELQPELMRFTVDTIAGLAFGADVNTLESDGDVIQQHLDKIFPAIFSRIMKPVPIWRYVRSAADRQLEAAIAEVKAAVDGFVAQARARLAAEPQRRVQPQNLLEAMIVAADEPGSGIDDNLVAGNVLTMLLAGEDTTANTLAWMTWLLWQNPEKLDLARAEVRKVCGDAVAPTLEQLARLDYVEACAHETMRLKPVAPLLPLQALRDVQLGDVHVPAGRIVMSLMRRDSVSDRHLPRAAAFEPERWLTGTANGTGAGDGSPGLHAASAKRISMPFGAGPRICPGRYLALLEMKMAMATLLGRFEIVDVSTRDGQPPRENMAFTMAPVGLSMRLQQRAASPTATR